VQKKPRILFLTLSLYPAQSGGPSNTIYWMGKALKSQGLKVATVTTSRDIEGKVPYDIWLEKDYGKAIYLDVPNYKYSPRILWEVIRQLRQSDLLQPASFFYPIALPAVVAAVLMGKKVVWSVRGEFFPPALGNSKGKRLLIKLVRFTIRPFVTFHSTSATETALIREHMGPKATIAELPNLIEISPSTAEQLHHSTSTPYLLFVGRINPIKALDQLLEALSLSRHFRQSPFLLKIAGNADNDYGHQLRALAEQLGLKEKVEFLGLVTGADKAQLFAGAYFSFLPSHSENFGNVVLESMAAGTPVIASKGTPWSGVEAAGAGFWCSNEPELLSKVIDQIFMLPAAEYQQYRRAARHFVETSFEVNQNIGRWINLYRNLKENQYHTH
jgi:glycosyltransferase involved in cell wall biosynthesis